MPVSKKVKSILFAITAAVIVFVVIVILFISPIAKYLIEKYSVKYLGRQVKMTWIYVNPFTGYAHFSNLKIYEYQSDSLFLTAGGLSADFAISKLLSKTYEISGITLNRPVIKFRQINRKSFNLDDVIERFTPKGSPDVHKEPVHFNLLNIAINNGEIYYIADSAGINYFIKKLDLKSSGLRWNADTIAGKFTCENGPGSGKIKTDFTLNLKSLDCRLNIALNKFDLNIIEQYFRNLANYGTLSANLDADLQANANFKDALALNAKGYIAINNFHFGKVPGEDYAFFQKLAISMIQVNPKERQYYIDTVMIDTPYFKYEKYDYLDNLQRIFGKNGEKYTAAKADQVRFNLIIQIADYLKLLAENFINSYYKINKLAIYRGNAKFADYSQREKFSAAAAPLYFQADSIDKNKKRVAMGLITPIQPYGRLAVQLSLDPNNYGNFDLDYKLSKIPLALFNPYLISYTSFPLDKGTLQFKGNMLVKDSNINSNNHLLILDPRVGKRLAKKDTKWVPMPLIMTIVREPSSVIDYEIPIRGRLSDPKFKFWNVIDHIIQNIFVKPPATPYLFYVKHLENEVEKELVIKWEMRSAHLSPVREKFVKKIADFLKSSPDASITISQLAYKDKEEEYILFFEAKKKYFLAKNGLTSLTSKDSVFVDKMSVKDSGFVRYLNRLTKDTLLFTIQEKCAFYVGNAIVHEKYKALLSEREKNFLIPFKQYGADNRIKFAETKTGVPFNGFSYYEINYKGEFPESLVKAYEKMDMLNDENPMKKYQKEREKNGGLVPEAEEISQKTPAKLP